MEYTVVIKNEKGKKISDFKVSAMTTYTFEDELHLLLDETMDYLVDNIYRHDLILAMMETKIHGYPLVLEKGLYDYIPIIPDSANHDLIDKMFL